MTNEEAIEYLNKLVRLADYTDLYGEEFDSEPFFDAVDVACDALRAQEKEPKWISVEDRLPEQPPDYFKDGHLWMVSGEDFIVADTDGKVYEAHWTYGCSCQRYFWYVNSLTPLQNITHWMPLPQPPEVEKQKSDTIAGVDFSDALDALDKITEVEK